MKKRFFCTLTALALLLSVCGAALAHGHHGGRGGHVWRGDGNGGYYCEGGAGHGSHCGY